jgi:hypothetical protein
VTPPTIFGVDGERGGGGLADVHEEQSLQPGRICPTRCSRSTRSRVGFLLHVGFGDSTRLIVKRGRRGFHEGSSARQGSPELAKIAGGGGGGKGWECGSRRWKE